MPARLVYSPKVYVYTQQQTGTILDVSKFVVSGQIDRKINQVSSANITLRNPQRKFTQPLSGEVAFHPMDPITIYLERIQGKPVRVFTGYLDTTPYFTLYPKTITLQASCTLKRLLYTYFDPSLPYTNAFFRKYGWYNMNDGTLMNLNAVTEKLDQTGNKLQDTSLGKLLWAVLYDIGQWQDSNIYIENLPNDIVQKVSNMATNLKQAEDTAVKSFELFLSTIIGDGVQGSGGGPGANTGTNVSTTAPSGGGQVPTTPQGGYNRNTWSIAFLQSLGAPVNDANVVGVMNWTIAEDGTWNNGNKYNPLNTTENMPGHVRGQWNSAGVKLYDSWATGLKATVKTISNGSYPNLLKDLTDGKGNLLGNEVSELNTWGTGPFTATTPQAHRLQGRVGASTTTTPQPIKSGTGQPPAFAQRGTKPITVQRAAARKTQAGFVATPIDGIGQAISTGATNVAATVNPANTRTTVRCIDALVSAAASINNQNLPYAWGGGHEHAGTPSVHPPNSDGSGTPVKGYDCSGSVAAVLSAGSVVQKGGSVPSSGSFNSYVPSDPGTGSGNPECTIFYNAGHVFMRLNGKMWGTGANGAGGPGWHDHTTAGFGSVHVSTNKLNSQVVYQPPGGAGGSGSGSVPAPTMQQKPLPKHDYGHTRSANAIKVVVLHSSEIAGGAGYFDSLVNTLNSGPRIGVNPDWDPPGIGLSVQCGINTDGTIARLMPDLNIPYGAVAANPFSVQVEQAGFSSQTSWPDAQINACAKLVAYWCWKYNIPVTHNKDHGVAFHSDGGKAWGNHSDPGSHYPIQTVLDKAQAIINQAQASSAGGTSQTNQGAANAFANAFVAQIEAPSLMDMVTATALGGMHMGLMHDQALLPFVQQLAQSSMRSFQSLPNGDFYAFYPDYFGEFGQHNPYWLIDDLEVLDGEINLSDDALATHVYAVGDTTWPISKGGTFAGQLMNMMQAGTMDVFAAFGGKTLAGTNKTDPVVSANDAVELIKRYGPRPLVQQYPMVRNQFFEMFLAYQQFMLAWSNQFKTPFTFTFMPELYPGGKVAFPDHGIQMYISSVSHTFSYSEGGFTTTAELSAPSVYGNNTEILPKDMVKMSEAMFEPIRKAQPKDPKKPSSQNEVQQTVISVLTESGQAVEQALQPLTNILSGFDISPGGQASPH